MQKKTAAGILFGKSPDYQKDDSFYLNNYIDNVHGYPSLANSIAFGLFNRDGTLIDKNTEYKTNSFGFRDKDWQGSPETIAAGCSMTYGSGVPVDARWSSLLSTMSKKNIRTISSPGTSIHEIVLQIFSHCKIFGNPKEIFCFFPDPFRTTLPVKQGLVTISGTLSAKETIHMSPFTDNKVNQRKAYIKKPYDYQDIVPLEFPLYFSMMAIHILEQYCKSNNINLLWSSWDKNFRDFLNRIDADNPFSNFFDIESIDYHSDEFYNRNCHDEEKNLFPEYFYMGQDAKDGEGFSHPGHHWHIHVAESFIKKLENTNDNSWN